MEIKCKNLNGREGIYQSRIKTQRLFWDSLRLLPVQSFLIIYFNHKWLMETGFSKFTINLVWIEFLTAATAASLSSGNT